MTIGEQRRKGFKIQKYDFTANLISVIIVNNCFELEAASRKDRHLKNCNFFSNVQCTIWGIILHPLIPKPWDSTNP